MRYILITIIALFIAPVAFSQQIEVKQTGFQNSFGKLQLPTANGVYVLDDNPSTLLSSVDGGAHWDSIPLPSDSTIYRYDGIQFLDENVGYVWGVAGCNYTHGTRPAIIKTVDKGKHWTIVHNDLPERGVITEMKFFNETKGTCFMPCMEHNGHPEKYYTEDGGNTWETINNYTYLYGEISKVEFIDNLNGFATGANNNLFFSRTEDGGLTWYSNVLNVMGGNGTGVKFFSPTNGILVSNDSIFTTVDAGDTWTKTKFPFSYNIAAFDFTDDGVGYFISDNNIYSTNDQCATWKHVYTSNAIYFSDIKISGNVGFVTGTDGHMLKLNLKSESKTNSVVANAINITVYPNPTNGTAKINYALSDNGRVIIELYDVLGQLVSSVMDESVSAGTYTYPIDLNKLNSGIYFLKSTIGGQIKTTKIIKR
jgi:photosystem II stability/assembly factor-like uncharacterized protein